MAYYTDLKTQYKPCFKIFSMLFARAPGSSN
ncbi:hypothetical protein QGX15_gp070 [Pseudomonas phage psageK4e]|uniref:Uncharacterized protein n=1 Tax=Pseudomonas phage psageK4e TaxID=2875723 RepID=A0AAE9BSJ2_9CAUD|nr:hypothetical protein QGX15_gp070 [Pseudomonas phage psageK4e]UAW53625.1 hypothetical protein psageK4e_177 [Pseudomonas phage psageK4e]